MNFVIGSGSGGKKTASNTMHLMNPNIQLVTTLTNTSGGYVENLDINKANNEH